MLTEEAREADFTNEAGVDGTVRFLQERDRACGCSRSACGSGRATATDVELARCCATRPPLPAAAQRRRHRRRRAAAARATCRAGWPALRRARGRAGAAARRRESPGWSLDSLAARLPAHVRTASTLAGVRPEVVHVVGGGSQNELLCQLTADACGLPVVAGPIEAAALGNVLVQARALGADLPDLAAMRALLRRTQQLTRYEPRRDLDWDAAEARRRGRVRELTSMRVALQVTCLNDALFPDTGKAVVTLLRRLGVDVEFPRGADLLRAADGQHRLPRRGGAGGADLRRRVRRVRRGRDAVRLVRGIGAAPAPDRRRAVG